MGAIVALGMVASTGAWAACVEHKIAGKTVEEVFADPGMAQLARAACRGDVSAVSRLVADGVDQNGAGLDGVPPLFWAIHCENLEGIGALLGAGADPNYRIPGRFTLVYQASSYRDSEILRLLLSHGGDPNNRTYDLNDSPVSQAIYTGIETGKWENYYLLIEFGLDVNQADSLGLSAATMLASLRQWDKVLELLNRGYDHDLSNIGRRVQFPDPSDPAQRQAKGRVKAILIERGVQFPVPPGLGIPGKPR